MNAFEKCRTEKEECGEPRRSCVFCLFVGMDSKQAEFLEVCRIGDVERVRELLGEGVDINTQHQVCVFDEHVF
jgi:hypothetical protein